MTAPQRGARYAAMFARLRRERAGAFIPFAMLGDPDPARSLGIVRTLARSGADAIELGFPFSDPIADGPVVQEAASRALEAGTRPRDCFAIVATVRQEFPELPIGLLVYANLVLHREPSAFYGEAAEAGVDSVLVADLPLLESEAGSAAARAHGIAPVFIAPPNASDDTLSRIARDGEAYTYVTTRAGVTGADDRLRHDLSHLLARLAALGAAPPVLGFGISQPAQVAAAIAMGAAGAISGSAVIRIAAAGGDLAAFVSAMKKATRDALAW